MSNYVLSESQLSAIASMKEKGFTHGKIELEAQLNRASGEHYEVCTYCDEGQVSCNICDGSGVVEDSDESPTGRTLWLTSVCPECEGDGYEGCDECYGDWEGSSTSWDEEACQEFLHEHVSPEARSVLTYSEFYYDGSVDSEFTFTLPLDKLNHAVEYIDAFNELAKAIGQGIDTSGAGMHLSVLTSGTYPSNTPLDRAKLGNFTREVSKLLPALFFVASPDHKSRPLGYRPWSIGPDKYNAISTHDGYNLEYRIFETCYQRPTALLEDFEVIANTLKYYSNRTITLEATSSAYDDGANGLARFYTTPDMLKALNDGLPFVKPKDKTITAMKKERNFKVNTKMLAVKNAIRERIARSLYEEYLRDVERSNERSIARMTEHRQELMNQTGDRRYWNSFMHELIGERGATNEGVEALLREQQELMTPIPFERWLERNQSTVTRQLVMA